MLNVAKEVSAMERMTVDQLRAKYAEVFGERTNGRHKAWLIKRIAWRLQANVEGDLSERARRRAMVALAWKLRAVLLAIWITCALTESEKA